MKRVKINSMNSLNVGEWCATSLETRFRGLNVCRNLQGYCLFFKVHIGYAEDKREAMYDEYFSETYSDLNSIPDIDIEEILGMLHA